MGIKIIVILLAILGVVLVWGLIGGAKSDNIGYTCDVGLGDGGTLCWKWHKNVVGQVQESLTAVGNAIQDSLDNIQKLN